MCCGSLSGVPGQEQDMRQNPRKSEGTAVGSSQQMYHSVEVLIMEGAGAGAEMWGLPVISIKLSLNLKPF